MGVRIRPTYSGRRRLRDWPSSSHVLDIVIQPWRGLYGRNTAVFSPSSKPEPFVRPDTGGRAILIHGTWYVGEESKAPASERARKLFPAFPTRRWKEYAIDRPKIPLDREKRQRSYSSRRASFPRWVHIGTTTSPTPTTNKSSYEPLKDRPFEYIRKDARPFVRRAKLFSFLLSTTSDNSDIEALIGWR